MVEDYFKVRVFDAVRVALPLRYVETVLQVNRQQICPIPGLSTSLLGVINRRGALTWVLDLRQFLSDLPPAQLSRNLTTVVLTVEGSTAEEGEGTLRRSIACIVTELEGVFPSPALKPFSKPVKPRLQEFFAGIATHEKSGVAVLDPVALLDVLHQESIGVTEPKLDLYAPFNPIAPPVNALPKSPQPALN